MLADLGSADSVARNNGRGDCSILGAIEHLSAHGDLDPRLEGFLRESGDGKRILSGSLDRTARLWDVDTGSELARFGAHEGPVYAVAFTKDGVLTGSGDRNIRLWNATGGDPVRTFAGGERLDR